MPIETHITSPALTPALLTSHRTLTHALSITDFLAEHGPIASSTPSTRAELSSQYAILTSLLSKLRNQTRAASYAARTTKSDTAETRQAVDRLQLQLQNLYYEQRHLLGEIDACEGYDHAYMHLPLDSEEDFLERMTEKGEEVETWGEEEVMRRRIEEERRERERLEDERKGLEEEKERLLAENGRWREVVKGVDERIEGFVGGLDQLGEGLEKDLEDVVEQRRKEEIERKEKEKEKDKDKEKEKEKDKDKGKDKGRGKDKSVTAT